MNAHGRSSLVVTVTKHKFVPYKSVCQVLFFNIHSPFEFPGTYEDESSTKFYYGQDFDVYITVDVIKSDDKLRSFTPDVRKCFFEDEKKLKMFKVYTRRNCEMECLAEFYLQHEELLCVPYYIIRNSSTPLCKIEKTNDVKFYKRYFEQNITQNYEGINTHVKSCGCLDLCNDIKYNVETIERRTEGKVMDYDNSTVTIRFMYKYDKYLPLVRRIAFSIDEFLCQAGGPLGLYAGISFLSIFELLYFVIIRPVFNMGRFVFEKKEKV